MAILNYTTEVPAEKTVGEIQAILAKAGAQAIMCEYHLGGGIPSHLSFRILTAHGLITFRLPCNIDKVLAVLKKDKRVENRYRNEAQAARVAWRILKTWVQAQMAIIETDMATVVQVFLPYAQDKEGKTVIERFEGSGFKALTDQRGAS